ncbi:hypothetical protein Ct61P_13931 [Colletotrichum tofieldiae]|nr:hypothetical protein Ct61P_10428 [Colletotrichum tofieldiae]GKT96081.1 hypothetical protein Ct61P_13931 [Colletotrichum tofieldiae]
MAEFHRTVTSFSRSYSFLGYVYSIGNAVRQSNGYIESESRPVKFWKGNRVPLHAADTCGLFLFGAFMTLGATGGPLTASGNSGLSFTVFDMP